MPGLVLFTHLAFKFEGNVEVKGGSVASLGKNVKVFDDHVNLVDADVKHLRWSAGECMGLGLGSVLEVPARTLRLPFWR